MPAPAPLERSQTVAFVRHAVARHNFRGADLHSPTLFDPPLVPQGKIAALEAGERIRTWWHTTQARERIQVVLCSPLTRCLQTATLAFLPGDSYEAQIPVECVEDVREAYGMHYPDKRRLKATLIKHWPNVCFSSKMSEDDQRWTLHERESWDDLQSRVSRFFTDLVNRREDNLVVVSHGVWIETCFRMYRPDFLGGERRVYNLDAFACHCISQNGHFVRIESLVQI